MNYFTILTDKAKADLVASRISDNQLMLSHIALGDGGGSSYEPQSSQTSLKNELLRIEISEIKQDENPPWLVIDALIPADQGGFMIREAGVFDSDGNLFAISSVPETYKPSLQQGSASELQIKLILEINEADNIILQIDPSKAIASQQYVDSKIETIKPLSEQELLAKLTNVDGHESGLDADMLDGEHASSFVLKSDLKIPEITPSYLNDKLKAGTGIALNLLNAGANEQLEISAAGGGKLLQIVSTTKDTQTAMVGTNWADTGLSLIITPISASSKILLMVSQTFGGYFSSYPYTRLMRGGIELTGYIQRQLGTAVTSPYYQYAYMPPITYNYVDEAQTTSPITYKTQFHGEGYTSSFSTPNRAGVNTVDHLIAIEIGA